MFFLVSLSMLKAQDIRVHGIVSDRQTGNALEAANVILKKIPANEVTGTTTSRNGLYEFRELQPGTYIFRVQYVGYRVYSDTLRFSGEDQDILKNIRLFRSNESLDEITISEDRKNVDVGRRSIRQEDLRKAPTPAGSADLASYVQTEPGVVATGDRGGRLFIRGGTPSENLVLVDGALIYQPFHILGFFSIFPEEVISKVDLYAGGYGAEYSSRTSSVMDIRLKNGNLYDRGWSASVSPFISSIFFESPIKEGESSIMVSLRGSLIEESSQLYLDEKQPLRFNNQLIKYSSVGSNVSCSGLFMRTYDRGKLDFDADDAFKWRNVVVSGGCAGTSEESSISFFDLNVDVSYFSTEVGNTTSSRRFSNVLKSHVDVSLVQNVGDIRLLYGFFTDYRTLGYDISEQFSATEETREFFLSSGLHAEAEIPIGNKVSIVPGFSATSYMGQIKASFEPRLQMSWQPRGRSDEEVHAALGIYNQPLVGLSDYRDAGTAFTAWIPLPDRNRKMEARHALLGWRQPLGTLFDFSVEGYYKKIKDTPVSVWSSAAQFTTDIAYANGSVYGTDVRLDFDYKHIYMGVGYSYSITEYQTAQDHFNTWFGEPIQSYNPAHDRRHQLNARAGVEVGNFTANVSWSYGSGLPFTRPMGFDSFYNFRERPPDVKGDYGNARVLLEKPFQGRMPDFHRLDVSVEQAFDIGDYTARIQGGAINAYDSRNLFYYDVFKQEGVDQLSFMPYISLKIESL